MDPILQGARIYSNFNPGKPGEPGFYMNPGSHSTRLDLDLDGDGRSEVQTLFSGDTGGGGFSFNVDFLNNYSTILGLP
jgi:hypothetical protein